MTWESWLIAISVVIIALAFTALIVFVIMTLLSLRQMVNDLDEKVRTFDPLFRVVNKAGLAIEKKASKIKQLSEDVEEEEPGELQRNRPVNTAMEVAEWAMIGMALWQKIREKKWR